jgi:hypothetical protein
MAPSQWQSKTVNAEKAQNMPVVFASPPEIERKEK